MITVLDGQRIAETSEGIKYKIDGCEVVRQNTKAVVFYGRETSFYKAAYPSGTRHDYRILPSGNIILKQPSLCRRVKRKYLHN